MNTYSNINEYLQCCVNECLQSGVCTHIFSVLTLVRDNNARLLSLTVAVPGTPNKELEFSLLHAAGSGYSQCAQILLQEAHVDPDAATSTGLSCLMKAAENGHKEVLECLISAGCALNKRSSSGTTALHYASNYGHLQCVKKLIESGASINIKDNAGNTPLHFAAMRIRYACKAFEFLAESPSIQLNVQNSEGRTPLHYVVNQADLITWCGTLLIHRANPDIQDNDGNTPFMLAATEGFDEVLGCLLGFHCNPNTPNNFKKAPLHFLAQKNHWEVIDMMSHLRCNMNPVDRHGNIPLYYAVRHNRPEAVKSLLVANSLTESPPGSGGENILSTALQRRLFPTGKMLVLAGCDVTPLYAWLQQVEADIEGRRVERLTLFEEQQEEEEVDEDLEDAVDWFSDWLHTPHSLQQICRIGVRRHLGHGILFKGSQLPVPEAIQDYITLKEVEDHHVEGYLMI